MHERTSDVKKEQRPIGDITDITLVVAGGEGSVCVCVCDEIDGTEVFIGGTLGGTTRDALTPSSIIV